MKRSTLLQVSAGVLIAAAGVWIFLRQVNIAEMLQEIQQMPFWKIAIVVALNPATLIFRAWRWKLLLPERNNCLKTGLFPLVVIGFMVNNLFPARIGEAARAALLWKRNRFTVAESVGSLVVERFIDVLVYVLFLVLPIVFLPQLSVLHNYGIVLAGGLCGVIICFFVYGRSPILMRRLARQCMMAVPARFRTAMVPIGKELISNLDWLFSLKRTAAVSLLSLITPLCYVGMLHVLGYGTAGFDILVSIFGIAFAAIGAAIPLAPGYVGTLHAMMLSGLGMAGIGADRAGDGRPGHACGSARRAGFAALGRAAARGLDLARRRAAAGFGARRSGAGREGRYAGASVSRRRGGERARARGEARRSQAEAHRARRGHGRGPPGAVACGARGPRHRPGGGARVHHFRPADLGRMARRRRAARHEPRQGDAGVDVDARPEQAAHAA